VPAVVRVAALGLEAVREADRHVRERAGGPGLVLPVVDAVRSQTTLPAIERHRTRDDDDGRGSIAPDPDDHDR